MPNPRIVAAVSTDRVEPVTAQPSLTSNAHNLRPTTPLAPATKILPVT
jgi:hypothetical protein